MSPKKSIPTSVEANNTIIEQQDSLNAAEQKELTDCEQRVASGNVEAAMALKTIHDEKLYRADFPTWEMYADMRWGYSKSYSHQVLKFAAMCEMIETAKKSADGRLLVMPTTERQVRPLASLADDAQRLMAWSLAMDQAGGKTPSGTQVEQAVSIVRKNERKPRKPKTSVAQAPTPTEAVGVDEAERREDTLDADCDASMNVSDDVTRQDANDITLDNDDVASKEESPDETGDTAESVSIGFAERIICSSDVQNTSRSEASPSSEVAAEDEPVPTAPLTLTPVRRKATRNTKRVYELAVAFRDAIADEVDAEVAARIYEAVQQILSEMPQAA